MRTIATFLLVTAFTLYAGSLKAQCPAVATFEQGFDNFATFPDSCWTANGIPGMTFYLNADTTGQELVFYGSTSVGTPYYLVAPELNTIDGNHYLAFNARPFSGLAIGAKIQIGTLQDPLNYATFTPQGNEITITDTVSSYTSINIPSDSSYHYVALKFTTVSPHQAIRLDNFKWQADTTTPPAPPCEAVSSIHQGFDNFTSFPDSCWTTSHAYPNFYLEDSSTDKYIVFYSMNEANTPFYLTTPELTNIDGNHVLKFKAGPLTPGDIKIQIGTLNDAGNYATFEAQGNEITINGGAEQEYTSIAIPADVNYKYVTLQITPTSPHQSVALDDFVWATEPTGIENIDQEQTVKLYPNPVKGSKLTIESGEVIREVIIFNAMGRKAGSMRPLNKKADLNIGYLSPGLYLMQIYTGKGSRSASFVKQ